MRRIHRIALVAGLALAAVVGGGVIRLHASDSRNHQPSTASHQVESARCRFTLSVSRMMGSTPFRYGTKRVDVIGDSYSVGSELAAPRTDTWDVLLARRLHWDLRVHGVGGTGFVKPGVCGDQTYQRRVPAALADRPDLVLIEGGLNDVERPGVDVAAKRLLDSLPATLEVIVIGPPPAPARILADDRRVDRELRAAVGRTPHRRYISTIDWKLPYLAPHFIHLTVTGHREFAARLATLISRGSAES